MQRISTWTVFKGEPVFFQAGSEGCSSSRTPGTDVPPPPNATPRPSPRTPGIVGAAPARGGRPGQAVVPRGAGGLVLCLWFLGFPLQGDDSPLFPVRRRSTARRIRREDDGKTARADSLTALFIPAHR